MLREAAVVAGPCTKIRKRCALSSSGASSEPQRRRRNLRLKRGVRLLGHRRGGSAGASPRSSRRRMSESSWNRRHRRLGDVETRSSSAASARKLVSALWQLNKGGAFEEGEVGWDAAAARRSSDHRRRASVEFSKMSRRKNKALNDDGERSWHNGHSHGQWFSDVMSNGGTTEVHTCPQGLTSPWPVDRMAQLQDLYNSLTASNELIRVLANVCAPGGLNPTAASLLTALHSELDAARARARQLYREHRRGGEDKSAEHLQEQLADEMRAWKSRHREKAGAYVRLVTSELEGERRSRRRAERASKKLGEALAEAESSLRAATRELERERASRERLEKVCDELASGGDAADEELRRDTESAREELEREREMLQLADELREERVRMKLAEARLQFEEKNAVVDQLRQELEAFLGTNKDSQESPADEHRHVVNDDHCLQLVLASELGVEGIDRVAVDKNDDDSEGSDIELNMDSNKDYSWRYSTASKRTTAKNAASPSSRHGSFSDRGTECGAGTFGRRYEGMGEEEEPEGEWDEGCSDDRTSTKDMDEDEERYEAIKNLREQMLAGHGFVFLSQGGADAERDHHRHGLICQIDEGGLW
ncbi:uncharacterized protein LOC133918971 [Phragmites australis]|uniref:uncharacterized protein LOC133918971 n=1 Tax=Phragmites australis TaxID=29695 RepID=UPI002D79658F|nr:uncharacterized protein LOC133918971 [Phragmites australis]XP_062219128.1 uncharacterized protein LOC133918971 [Phragmites australis]XP_062219129.1 uncharacterized protein LOC133918971 [Phragmites australis]